MISRRTLANAIRVLGIDAIQEANSGHPGCVMGMADIAEVLWRSYMNHNPSNPNWFNRDRFVLSNGHCSMILYSVLHLSGYDLSIEEIKKFRKLHSKTPGHPEYNCTAGVEMTTGPLGQGIANAVGLAIAERTLSAQFNRPGYEIINHYTYVFLGDGCIMEGISHEACSLAGVMNLGKLIAFYDSNGISIDGDIKGWCNDDTAARFEAYGWHVVRDIDGHDSDSIKSAIDIARLVVNKPSLLICKTIIAFGSPNKSGMNISHGSPLGTEETSKTKKSLRWYNPPFVIPKEIYLAWDARKSGREKENIWKKIFLSYERNYPDLANELNRRMNGELPNDWRNKIGEIVKLFRKTDNISGRQASFKTLQKISDILPELLGGSADLSSSNLTILPSSTSIINNPSGNYIHYGAREFGMVAIGNGIARHGGFIPYTATFLTFSEYAQNAIRMAALMKIHHIMIYTHDSVGLGEDGPTHQPIEQLTNLRMIPNMISWRPCDQMETLIAWKQAIEHNYGPTALILSKQTLFQQRRTDQQVENISRGGYILKDCNEKNLDVIIIATGSEVELAVSAYLSLINEGYNVRVVSMPSTDVFDRQDKSYRELVLPKKSVFKIAIEAGSSAYWHKYVGSEGEIIGIDKFGKSASAEELFRFFGFTVENIVNRVKVLLK